MKTIILLMLGLTSCYNQYHFKARDITQTVPFKDDYVVVGSAFVDINVSNNIVSYKKRNLLSLLLPNALAYVGPTPSSSVNITYTNAASSNFVLTSGSILSSPVLSLDGQTLSFGSITIGSLDDNKLKVCGSIESEAVSGSSKCNTAVIRVYAVSGNPDGVFCNTTESYCVPMKVNGNVFGIGVANANTTITHTIPNNINRLQKNQLSTTTWPLDVDTTNAGEGNYSVTVVIEYALKRL